MRFLLLKGASQYGSLRLHVDQLAAALSRSGDDAVVLDLLNTDETLQLNAGLIASFDCVFCFNGLFAPENGAALAALGVTYATMFVDHPAHHLARLQTPQPGYLAFFLDRTHVSFMERLTGPEPFALLAFCPPGANIAPMSGAARSFQERDIDILFSGTYRGAPARPWADMPSPVGPILAEAAERMAADSALPLLDALDASAPRFGVQPSAALVQALGPVLAAVQSFAEAYHRDAFVHAVGAAGVPLTLTGVGWTKVLEAYPSFAFLGEGSFAETLDLLARTRIAVNVNNGFVCGGHERVFAAMAAGAAVFSETSGFYDEAFVDGRDYRAFSRPGARETADALLGLLAAPATQERLALNGVQRIDEAHLWRHRAGVIRAAVAHARAGSGATGAAPARTPAKPPG